MDAWLVDRQRTSYHFNPGEVGSIRHSSNVEQQHDGIVRDQVPYHDENVLSESLDVVVTVGERSLWAAEIWESLVDLMKKNIEIPINRLTSDYVLFLVKVKSASIL